MNKYIIFFASGWIALFSSNVYTACLENGGSNICKRALKSDWVLIDSYNLQPINISSGYKLTLLPSDAKPLMSLVYKDQWDDRANKFVHTYRFNDNVLSHQKRWDRYTPSSESRLYDYINFGVNHCNHWSAPETCEPYALRFRSYWHCYNEPGIENGKIGNIDKKTSLQYPDSKESYLTGKIFNSPPYIRICEIPKNKIKGKCDGVGNPCSITTGNKFQRETDWTSPTGLLSWFRTYNSIDSHNSLTSMGQGWLHNYQKSLKLYINDYQNNIKKVPLYQVDLTESDHQEIYGTLIREGGEEIDISGAYSDEAIAGQNGWFIARDKSLKLTQQADGLWRVDQLKTGIKEYYDITGKFVKMTYPNGQFITLTYADVQLSSTTLLTGMLVKVTDSFGRSLQFSYNSKGLISVVTLPNNKQMTYQYDDQRRLVSVTRPSYGTKTYHYSESITIAPSGNPNLLTGITDEAGKRYANYAYDSVDRGVLTEHADGAQKYTLQHTDSYTRVTDPNGTTWLYNKILASGTPRVSSSLRAGSTQIENSYDQAGNITQKTEKGLTTKYTYDLSRNLETSRTEAVSTAQERKIETTWHGDFPKPTEIKESSGGQILRVTVFSYDNSGNALSKTITDPQTQEARTWLYEYNNYGQLIKETNPQGQISNYQYDETNGNLLKTISADGITTTYSQHNADGQPQHIESSNGQIVDLVYDDAGRIIQQKQTIQQDSLSSNGHSLSWWQVIVNNFYSAFGSDAPYSESNQIPEVTEIVATQIATTNYEYDLRGLLIATKLPDGERIEYTYDDAHRLTEIKDQSGNRTVYSLNASGDITQTEVYGGSGQLEAKNQQVFDSLGRLQQSLGNSQQQQITSYNNYDQVQSDKNALNQNYSYSYDVLGRQISETDPLGGYNKTEYDSFDQIKKVIDAKSGTTTYLYNAFGEKTAQNNPDTGTTVYQYQNGLLKEKTDALQLKHQYEYDTQGRITLLKDQKTDGSDNYEQTEFTYGQTANDLGKLTTAKNKRSETYLSYNNLGLVRQKAVKYLTTNQSITPQLKLNYSYTLGGKLKQLALPSGNVVNYDYSATGQLTGIRLNDQSFIGNIQYNANGVKGWTYTAVGDAVQYVYDLDGRIKQIQMPNVFDKNYSFDTADRILSINDSYQSLLNNSFKHDALSRLTEQTTASKTFKYTYDKNSNRLSRQTTEGTTTTTENYTIATNSNRLNNLNQGTSNKPYTYLATGQITSDGARNYAYDAQGRSETISRTPNTILNAYDAFGQRIQKFSGNNVQTLFMYDEDGQLLGEYSPDGEVIREYIWLNGTLVGLRSYQYPNEILRVHTDHLGTPRAISDHQNQVVWRWEGDQFGDVLPQSSVNLVMPIRHAGQYFDAEVGIFYNYFRDYDPITGRYIESDPIGLDGGLNTYGYVGGSPLHAVDPRGQFAIVIPFLPEIGLMLNTIGIAILSQLSDVNNPPKDEKCEREDNCGPYTRVQAYAIAQTLAQISRKERYHRSVTDSSLNRTSQGKCYNRLKSAGATHLGYGCEWQNSWIEDHPDGHSHLPGEAHHDCPHLHVYKNGISVGIVQYKRGSF